MLTSRRLPALLPVLALSFGLAGCLGGSSEPQVSAPAGPPPAEPPAGVIAGPVAASLLPADVERGFRAQVDALDKGQRVSWRGEKTAFGFVEPGAESGSCRSYTHTVYLDGRAQRGSGQACRRGDGRWSFS